jgi:hypothetical protein
MCTPRNSLVLVGKNIRGIISKIIIVQEFLVIIKSILIYYVSLSIICQGMTYALWI